jgi:hypothetical protein
MNPTSKKFISLFLVFLLMMLSANLYAKERRGAKLIVQRRGDQVQTRYKDTPWETSVMTGIRGELIAVKPNSLLLLDTEGKDVSIDIADIKVIRVVKKSKLLLGAGIGLVVFGACGALRGSASHPDDSAYMLWGGILGGGAGLLVGALIGAVAGTDKTIQIEGMSDLEIREALDKLRKKARIRDYK